MNLIYIILPYTWIEVLPRSLSSINSVYFVWKRAFKNHRDLLE